MKKYDVCFAVLFSVMTVSFTALCMNGNVWYDEAYTMEMIKHTFGEISKITAADVHPPLYYYMLKLFMLPFGESVLAAKIFSIIPMCLTMLLGYSVIGREVNKRTGILFCIFFALMPVFTVYAVQIRMYTWCAFFVFACGIFAYKTYSEDKISYWILTAIFASAAAYSHYFALVSAGIIYGILMIAELKKKRFLRWLIFAGVIIMSYIPWLASFISQLADKVENEYWIAPITVSTICGYFKTWFKCGNYTVPYIVGSFVIYVLAAVGMVTDKNLKLKTPVLLGVAVFVLTNLVGIVASVLVRPVFIERYAIAALPFLALFAAIGIGTFKPKFVRVLSILFFVGGFVVNYPVDFRFEYGETDFETGEYINSNDFDALICYVDSQLYGVLSYYAPELPVYRPKTSQGSPFYNIYPLSDFDVQSCRKVALFIPDGAEVPKEVLVGFESAEYDRDVVTYGQKSNVFILER